MQHGISHGSSCSTGQFVGQTKQSAARKQNDEHQQWTEYQLPLLGDATQCFLDQ